MQNGAAEQLSPLGNAQAMYVPVCTVNDVELAPTVISWAASGTLFVVNCLEIISFDGPTSWTMLRSQELEPSFVAWRYIRWATVYNASEPNSVEYTF